MSDSDLDDINVTDFDTGERRGGRFKKNADNQAKRTSTASTTMQLQLNKLSDREVDDSNMTSVFGASPVKPATDSMRVNPLYEKGVKPAKRNSAADIEQGSGQNYDGPSDEIIENGKVTTNEEGPTLIYNDNFKLKNKGSPPNKPKVAKFGRIIPARVKRNTHFKPRRQQVSNGNKDPGTENTTNSKERMELIEENFARRRIRRGCRYVILVILAFLVFILLLAIVLYFATQGQ
ncbi:uncharacterized protein [Apostichopus japonicus]|uniref:uncharacterized protein isoform X2 n=1 Tax=Stichopus japonicus TaxID=307972 RepID=UPI003AB5299A